MSDPFPKPEPNIRQSLVDAAIIHYDGVENNDAEGETIGLRMMHANAEKISKDQEHIKHFINKAKAEAKNVRNKPVQDKQSIISR